MNVVVQWLTLLTRDKKVVGSPPGTGAFLCGVCLVSLCVSEWVLWLLHGRSFGNPRVQEEAESRKLMYSCYLFFFFF